MPRRRYRITALAAALVALGGPVASAQQAPPACGPTLRRAVGGGADSLDLASPAGYDVDVCAEDAALCRTLTAGYPPSVTTLAYLVPAGEWDAVRAHRRDGFAHYLIAQLAGGMTSADLPRLSAHLHAQQGDVPDHTDLPATLEARGGRVPLGVFDETPHSIAFGVVMRLAKTGDPSTSAPVTLVATNAAVVVGDRLLSVYVFREWHGPGDVEAAEALTRQWLACMGASGGRRKAAP